MNVPERSGRSPPTRTQPFSSRTTRLTTPRMSPSGVGSASESPATSSPSASGEIFSSGRIRPFSCPSRTAGGSRGNGDPLGFPIAVKTRLETGAPLGAAPRDGSAVGLEMVGVSEFAADRGVESSGMAGTGTGEGWSQRAAPVISPRTAEPAMTRWRGEREIFMAAGIGVVRF